MLYTVFPICGYIYMDLYLCTTFKILITKALHCYGLTFDSVGYTWKVRLTTVINVVTSLQSILDVALHRRMFIHFPVRQSELPIQYVGVPLHDLLHEHEIW